MIPFGPANIYLALLLPAFIHLAVVITSPVPGVSTNSRPMRLKPETYLVTRRLGILPIITLIALETLGKQQLVYRQHGSLSLRQFLRGLLAEGQGHFPGPILH